MSPLEILPHSLNHQNKICILMNNTQLILTTLCCVRDMKGARNKKTSNVQNYFQEMTKLHVAPSKPPDISAYRITFCNERMITPSCAHLGNNAFSCHSQLINLTCFDDIS